MCTSFKLALLASLLCLAGKAQTLTIINQDYHQALSIAAQENKLILVDFYTTWCVPCKQLDKWVFQNDSIKSTLGQDFILLRYDAEKDSFHLSKKHHVMSYPTGLILNKDGYVLDRKYGFPGNDAPSLCKAVLQFTNQGLAINKQNQQLLGYSNTINISRYPSFYIDYINRKQLTIDSTAFDTYWRTEKNINSEEYFSTLVYFNGRQCPGYIIDSLIKNRAQYETLFGKTDVEVLFYFLASDKFQLAIAHNSQSQFDQAAAFMNANLGPRYMEKVLPSFQKDLLEKQNKWNDIFHINQTLKDKGSFSDDAINTFCWNVYKKCQDRHVIAKCQKWMQELTNRNPEYAYLDTYAFLLSRTANKKQTRKVAQQAIAAAKAEKVNTKNLEALLLKIK